MSVAGDMLRERYANGVNGPRLDDCVETLALEVEALQAQRAGRRDLAAALALGWLGGALSAAGLLVMAGVL